MVNEFLLIKDEVINLNIIWNSVEKISYKLNKINYNLLHELISISYKMQRVLMKNVYNYIKLYYILKFIIKKIIFKKYFLLKT